MNFKNDIFYPILLAVGYFISIFAFIAALGPVYLGLIALVVTLLTVLELAWLRHIGMTETGPVIFIMGLCAISPWLVRLIEMLGVLKQWASLKDWKFQVNRVSSSARCSVCIVR